MVLRPVRRGTLARVTSCWALAAWTWACPAVGWWLRRRDLWRCIAVPPGPAPLARPPGRRRAAATVRRRWWGPARPGLSRPRRSDRAAARQRGPQGHPPCRPSRPGRPLALEGAGAAPSVRCRRILCASAAWMPGCSSPSRVAGTWAQRVDRPCRWTSRPARMVVEVSGHVGDHRPGRPGQGPGPGRRRDSYAGRER